MIIILSDLLLIAVDGVSEVALDEAGPKVHRHIYLIFYF